MTPTLKCKIEMFFTVDWHDLESFINLIYNIRDYSFTADQEAGNDTEHEFRVTGQMSARDTEELKKYLETPHKGTFKTRLLLDDLCDKGHIQAGKYLISVSW